MAEPLKQDQTRKKKTLCSRIWLLAFLACSFCGPLSANPVFAQETNRKLRSGPPPEYPALARKLNIKGIARVRFTITTEGRVKDVKELGGNPILLSALTDAVKKWRYEPAAAENEAEVKFEFE